jgi:uncharacterized cupredoxin-like copper-binding protein
MGDGPLRGFAMSLLGACAIVGVACSGGTEGGIDATLDDYTISLDDTSGESGKVTFNIHNDAAQTHEFVVFGTDLPEDQLPTDDSGDVDEKGGGLEVVDEVEDIAAGADATLSVNLDAGNYVVICNLPGHYRQGMHESFTIA